MNLVLKAAGPVDDMFEIARLLVRASVPIRGAKKVTDTLAAGHMAFVDAPAVEDYARLKHALKRRNVDLRQFSIRAVDVKALRTRLELSQEDFAGRYGLDVATVRNWEQGRTKPEGPAAALLHLIESDPDKVLELMLRREDAAPG